MDGPLASVVPDASSRMVPPALAPAPADPAPDLRRHWRLLLAQRWLIAGVAGACLLVAVLYALLAAPVFEANMLIQVEERNPNAPRNVLNEMAALVDSKKAAVAEMEILRSRAVLLPAVERLRLDLTATPRYPPLLGRWLEHWDGAPLFAPGVLGVGGYSWGGDRLAVQEFEVPASLLGHQFVLTARADQRFEVRAEADGIAFSGAVGAALRVAVPQRSDGNTAAGADSASGIRLTVTQLQARPGTAFLLRRASRSAVMEALQKQLTVSEQGRQSGMIALRLRGPERLTVSATLAAIGQEYLRQNQARRAREAEQSLAFLNAQLPELKQRLAQAEEQYSQFRNAHGTVDLDEEAKLTLQQEASAQQRRVDLEQKRTELLMRYTPEHPIVQGVEAQLRGVAHEIERRTRQIHALPQLEQDAARLSRDIKLNTELYTALQNTAQQLKLVAAGEVGLVRLVDAPEVPEQPLWPRRSLIVAGGAGGGLVLGWLAAVLRAAWTGGIREPQQIEEVLGVRAVAAVIPHSRAQDQLNRQRRAARLPLLAEDWPEDVAVEALRVFRSALLAALPALAHRIVMLTSPLPGQGKSFLAANLAVVVAASGKRVLLIDADWRKGQLHRHFGLAQQPGLSEVIDGAVPWSTVLHRAVLPQLDFVATGSVPPSRAECLMQGRFRSLLLAASQDYDLVLLDTPPVLAVADALVIGSHADAVFLAVRAGVSGEAEILEAIRRLSQAGASAQGLLFNDLPLSLRAYGYRYGYEGLAQLGAR